MKAVILAAGIGSRLMPLTAESPKTLLKIHSKPIINHMLTHIRDCEINNVVMVVGYREDQIRTYVRKHFPDLKVEFILNENYAITNTAYSLWLAYKRLDGSGFIKFDADVVFDKRILNDLVKCPGNCLCIDTQINMSAEEVKVMLKEDKVIRVGKDIHPDQAQGESIGIEKLEPKSAELLFKELNQLMAKPENYDEYYERAYENLINKGMHFHALDITGHRWVEIDSHNDLDLAYQLFN